MKQRTNTTFLLIIFFSCFIANQLLAQPGRFRTNATTNTWSNTTAWQEFSSSLDMFVTASRVPGSNDTVEINRDIELDQVAEVSKMLITGTSAVTISRPDGTSHYLDISDSLLVVDPVVFSLAPPLIFKGDHIGINSAATINMTHLEIAGTSSEFTLPSKISQLDILSLDRSSGMKLSGNTVIKDSLALTSGTLDMNSQTLTLNRVMSIVAATQLSSTSGTLKIGGSSSQFSLSNLITTLHRLELNRANGMQLNTDLVVSDSLILSNGVLDLNGEDLTLDKGISATASSTIGSSSGKMIVSDDMSTQLLLPAQIDTLFQLELNRANGMQLNGDLTVRDDITLTRGSLDAQTHTLSIEKSFLANGGQLTGTRGSSGYKVKTGALGSNQATVKGPDGLSFNKFQIAGNTKIFQDMIVLDSFIVNAGTTLNRLEGTDTLGVAAAYMRIYGIVNPTLPQEENAALTALKISGTGTSAFDEIRYTDTPNFTQELWAKFSDFSESVWFEIRDTSIISPYKLEVRVSNDGECYVSDPDRRSHYLVGGGGHSTERFKFAKGEDYHIAISLNTFTGALKVYVNSVLLLDATVTTNSKVNSLFVYSVNSSFTIDGLRLWNIVRTKKQIRRDYRKHLKGTEPGLMRYYRIDEKLGTASSGDIVYDYTPNKGNFVLNDLAPHTEWIRSTAKIEEFRDDVSGTSESEITNITSGENFGISSAVKFFKIHSMDASSVVGTGRLRVDYYNQVPGDGDLPVDIIDSIRSVEGYWELSNIKPSSKIEKVRAAVNTSALSQAASEYVLNRLVWLYRYSYSSEWNILGRGRLESTSDNVAQLDFTLGGSIQLVLGVRTNDVKSRQSGRWSNSRTWNVYDTPLSGDSVTIQHQVTLDSRVSDQMRRIGYLNLSQSSLILEQGKILQIENNLFRTTGNIESIQTGSGIEIIEESESTPKLYLPSGISSLNTLIVNRTLGVSLLDDITLNTLRISKGSFNVRDKTLSIIEGISSTSSELSPITWEASATLDLATASQTVQIPSWLDYVPNLNIRGSGGALLSGQLTVNQRISVASSSYFNLSSGMLRINGEFTSGSRATIIASDAHVYLGTSIGSASSVMLPLVFSEVKKLTIDRSGSTIELQSNLIADSLHLKEGTLDVKNYVLELDEIEINNGNMQGITGSGGYKLVIKGSGDMQWPVRLTSLNKLVIDRFSSTISLNNNLEIIDTLQIKDGTLDVGIRTLSLSGAWSSGMSNGGIVGVDYKIEIAPGSGTFIIPARFQTASTLEINRNTVLSDNLTVTKQLRLLQGNFDLGSFQLFIDGNIVQESGNITGNVGADGYSLFIGSSQGAGNENVVELPPGINELNKLIIQSPLGLRISASLTVTNFLELRNSTLYLQNNVLRLNGGMGFSSGSRLTGTLGENGYKILISEQSDGTSQSMVFPSSLESINKLEISRRQGMRLSNRLSIIDSLRLTRGNLILAGNTLSLLSVFDRTLSSSSSDIIEDENSSIIVGGSQSTPQMIIPSWKTTFRNLVLDRPNGMLVNQDISVTSLLHLKNGVLDMRTHKLMLLGSISCDETANLVGEEGDLGYEILIQGDASFEINWPSEINRVNRLVIDRKITLIAATQDTVVRLQNNLVIANDLRLIRGILHRGSYVPLVKRLLTNPGDAGFIYPSLATFSSEVAGQALSFNMINAATVITSADALNPVSSNEITVECHLFVSSSPSLGQSISLFSKHDGVSGYELKLLNGNHFLAKVGSIELQTSTFSLQQKEWYHVAMTFKENILRVYLEGVLIDSVETGNQSLSSGIARGQIGGQLSTSGASIGLDEIKIWSYARTENQLRSTKNRLFRGDEANLLAYYRMDEGQRNSSQDTVYDYSKTKAHAVFTTGNVLRVSSGAEIEFFESTPLGSNLQNVGNGTNVAIAFDEGVRGFKVIGNVSGRLTDKLRISHRSGAPQERQAFAIEGLDSIKSSAGYWTTLKPDLSSSITNAKFEIDINEIETGSIENPRNLSWIVRYAPSKKWISVGREVIGENLIRSVIPIPLTGYLEIALATVNTMVGVVSVSDGDWNLSDTWFNGVKPSPNDSVVIRHNIVLSSERSIRYLTIANDPNALLTIRNGASLEIRNNVFPSEMNQNGGIKPDEGKLIISGSGSIFNFPSQIQELNILELKRSSGLRLSQDLTVHERLILTEGRFYLNGKNLTLNNDLSMSSDFQLDARDANSRLVIGENNPGQASQFFFPSGIINLENLTLNRSNGMSLQKDLVIKQELNLVNGTLNRTVGNLIAKNILPSLTTSLINPPFSRDSTASGVAMNAQSAYGIVSHHSSLNFSKAMTIEAWVSKTAAGDGIIVQKENFLMEWENDGSIVVHLKTREASSFQVKTDPQDFELEMNKWYHVAVVYLVSDRSQRLDVDTATIYINATKVAQTSITGGDILPSFESLTIGANQLGFRKFNGSIDELRIWSEARTPSQLRQFYLSEISGLEQNLVAYYRFNEHSSSIDAYDYTVSALNARLTSPTRIQSGALLQAFAPTPSSEQIANIQNVREATFSNVTTAPLRLIFDSNATIEVRVVHLDAAPRDATELPAGIKNIEDASGYWEIMPIKVTTLAPETRIAIPISSLDLLNQFTAFNDLKVLTRPSPQGNWQVLDGLISQGQDTLYSREKVSLNGYFQVSVGMKARYITTKQSGLWSSPQTWAGNILPKPGEHVEILHDINQDVDVTIGDIILGDAKWDISQRKIVIAGNIQTSASSEIITSHNVNFSRIEFVPSQNLAIPSTLSTVDTIVINPSKEDAVISLAGNLRVKKHLDIKNGFLNITDRELLLEGTIDLIDQSQIIKDNSTVVYLGDENAIINSKLKEFYNLKMNKASGSELEVPIDIVVLNRLELVSGVLRKTNNARVLYKDIVRNGPVQVHPEFLSSSIASIRALRFSETGDVARRLIIPHDEVFSQREFTVEAWIKGLVWQSSINDGLIVGKASGLSGWEITSGDQGRLRAVVYTTREEVEATSQNFRMKTDQWYHVALTFDREGELNLYINGVLVGQAKTQNQLVRPAVNAQDIYIASNSFGTKRFIGLIDELRIWGKVKTPNEIKMQDSTQLKGNEPFLTTLHSFDEGQGSYAYNLVSDKHHASMTTSSGILWTNSGAFISQFSDLSEPYEEDRKTFTPVSLGSSSSLTTFKPDIELKMEATIGSGDGLARIVRLRGSPIQHRTVTAAIDSFITQKGYWKISKTRELPLVINLKVSTYIGDLMNVSKEKLVWAYRTSPVLDWEFIGGTIKNDTIYSIETVSFTSTLEFALVSHPPVRVTFRAPKFDEEQSTDIALATEVIVSLEPSSVEVSFQASKSKSFPLRDVVQSTYVSTSRLSDTSLYGVAKISSLFEGRDYFARVIVRISGLLYDTLPEIYRFGTPPLVEDQPIAPTATESAFSKFSVMPDQGIPLVFQEGLVDDSLRLFIPSEKISKEGTMVVATKYASWPIQSLGKGRRENRFYWSLYESTNDFFSDGRLYYSMKALAVQGIDTSVVRWFERKDSEDPEAWVDITDTTESVIEILGERYLRTQKLSRLYDYTIASLESPPIAYGVLQPEINFVENNEDLKVTFGLEFYTGASQTQVQFNYANDINFSAPNLVGDNSPAKSVPEHQAIHFLANNIKRDSLYFYTASIVNRQGSPLTQSLPDTIWFYTKPFALQREDTLYAAKGRSVKNLSGMYLDIVPTLTSGHGDGYPFYTEVYFSGVVGGRKPSEVNRINPFYWAILPKGITSYLDSLQGPIKSLRSTRRIGKLLHDKNQTSVFITKEEFPEGTNFESMRWLKRDTVGKNWLDIGGELVDVDGKQVFRSVKPIDDILGEYSIGSTASANAFLSISDFNAQIIGGGKSRISWRVNEQDNIHGFDVIQTYKAGDRVIASFKDNSVLRGRGTTSNFFYYAIEDEGLKYGREKYTYRLRYYDNNGNVYDYDELTNIVTAEAPEADPLYKWALKQNFPNPFSDRTTIRYTVKKRTRILLELFDLMGRKVSTIVSKEIDKGDHSIVVESGSLATGIYFYRMVTDEFVRTRKMMVIR